MELAEETYSTFDRAASKNDLDGKSIAADLDRLREQYVDLYEFSQTVAESSIIASKRGGAFSRAKVGGLGKQQPVSSVKIARRLWRRGKGKIRRTIYARSKSTSRTSSNGAGPADEAPVGAGKREAGSS